jgi:hypothetical protein
MPETTQPDEGSTFSDRAEKIAKAADEQLGLKDPDYGDLEKEIRDLEVGKLLGATGQHPTVKLVNTHVSFASAWLIVIAVVSGSGAGTIASVVQAVTRGVEGKATVGAYADVAVVFITAFALCTTVAALIYLAREGAIKGYGAIFGVCLGIVLWCWFLNSAGIASPDPDDLLRAMSSASNPLLKFGALVPVFVTFYGIATFLSGLGVGAIAGNLGYRIAHPEVPA